MYMVITISREFGSGGSLVGHKLAEALGIPCYDKTVEQLASVETGFTKEVVRSSEDKVPGPFAYANFYTNNTFLPVCDRIFIAQREIILRLVRHSDCVIVGRCAAEILKTEGIRPFSVFVYAPKDERISRTADKYQVTLAEAEKMIKKNDKARALYNKQYCDFEWGKAQNYDLCLNTTIGIEKAVKMIQLAVSE